MKLVIVGVRNLLFPMRTEASEEELCRHFLSYNPLSVRRIGIFSFVWLNISNKGKPVESVLF